MIGKTVSHYKILEKLGGGGMGVVYKAEDTALKRTVAVKSLPPILTTDPEARQRFIHEAQAASALDHPNICTVHDFGTTDDGQMFIVMACYEGEALNKKIERGPLALNDALDIVVQVTLGLSKAHEHGIVHRDIKPANIMITDQGEVKILDFGLAKLSGISIMTRTGTTMGTVAYMAPEQARGEKVDQRTDLWSLGVVLYQMLTGVLPFRSDYEQALVYSIMNDEPKGVRQIKKDIPENIELIVQRLMSKEPADRYASADDLLVDLLAVRENSSARLGASAVARRKSTKRRRRLVLGMAAVALPAAVVLALFVLPKRGAIRINPNHLTRVLLTQSYQLGAGTSQTSCYPGISWDGNWVSTAAPNDSGQWGLYFMQVAWNEPRRIPVEGNIGIAKISPDGAHIAFSATPSLMGGRELLRVVSTSGGEVKTLEKDFHNLTWHPNGTMLGYSRDLTPLREEFWSVNKDGTDKRLVFSDTLTSYMNAACWSPNGQSVAYIRTFREGHSELMTRDLRTGKEQQLTFDRKYADEPFWMSNGNILFASTRSGSLNIWAIPERGGEPVQVTTSGGRDQGVTASGDGKRILVPETDMLSEIWISDLSGSHIRQIKLNRFASHFAMAPDYSRFVFISPEEMEQWVLYVADKDGTNRRRIGRINAVPRWQSDCISLDGNWFAYAELGRLYVVDINNPGVPKRVCESGRAWTWSDEGDLLVLTNDWKTMQYSTHDSGAKQVFEDSTYAVRILHGRYVLYLDYREGRRGRWIVSIDRQGKKNGQPRKLPGGRALGSYDASVWLYEKTPGKVWRIRLPECKENYVGPASILERFPGGVLNIDGTQGAFIRNNTTQKLTLIENLFE